MEAYDSLYAIPFRDGDGPDDHMGMEVPSHWSSHSLSTTLFGWKDWVQEQHQLSSILEHAPRAWRIKSGSPWERAVESANQTENIIGRRIQGGSTSDGGSSFWDSRECVSLKSW